MLRFRNVFWGKQTVSIDQKLSLTALLHDLCFTQPACAGEQRASFAARVGEEAKKGPCRIFYALPILSAKIRR